MSITTIPTKHLFYMILLLIVSITFAFIVNLPIYIGILASICYIFFIAKKYGYETMALLYLIRSSFKTVKTVLFMLILIAAILPLWMVSGTLPTLIYYSFIHLSSLNVPLAAFAISTLLSLMLGTFIGTLSIVGPLFMSLAMGLNIPPALMASALISGSAVGDRLSPISSNFHLICASCGSEINKTIVATIKTNLPALIITFTFYALSGQHYQLDVSGYSNIASVLSLLESHFQIHFAMILPMFLLLMLILSKKLPIVASFLVTFFCSIGFYIFVGLDITALPSLILSGYHPDLPDLSQLISGSGIASMIAVPIIILCSAYLNDLLKHTHLMSQALDRLSSGPMTLKKLYLKTEFLSILVTIISCNQSLTAIITGQHFQKQFDDFSINRSQLARVIADTGSLVITVIPWNLNALVASSITGVLSIHYIPYMVYVYVLLLITTLVSLLSKGSTAPIAEKTAL
ncbi:MAG: hypothetical protein JXO44_03765 [Clostridia bacterium]|nr:hypothetical protein [Clostridia bacterium]